MIAPISPMNQSQRVARDTPIACFCFMHLRAWGKELRPKHTALTQPHTMIRLFSIKSDGPIVSNSFTLLWAGNVCGQDWIGNVYGQCLIVNVYGQGIVSKLCILLRLEVVRLLRACTLLRLEPHILLLGGCGPRSGWLAL